MVTNFDPYHKWLGIAPKDQPPNLYRLLGIDMFGVDADVISLAADQRMAHLRTFQAGQNAGLSQRLLNEIATARVCLLNPEKKTSYDRKPRQQLGVRSETRASTNKNPAARAERSRSSTASLEASIA